MKEGRMDHDEMDFEFELHFSKDDVDLLLSDPLIEGDIVEQLRTAVRVSRNRFAVTATTTSLEELLEWVAAEANHCGSLRLEIRLDRLYMRLEELQSRLFRLLRYWPEDANPRLRLPSLHSTSVSQFRIELLGTDPPVWRRIQIATDATFWELHTAIQDAMGWQDYHLHEFVLLGTEDRIGIPLDDDPQAILPGWQFQVDHFLTYGRPLALYQYDFGDSWFHEVRFEVRLPMDRRRRYPRCIDGKRLCPPEDCGGVGGYVEFLQAVTDPTHPEHHQMLHWAGGRFDPDAFAAHKVRFTDPMNRLAVLLEG
jgi:hypothetical protein